MVYRLILIVLVLHVAGCRQETPAARLMLARACTWLWSQQNADGGWHSETHGILKGGQSLSPFILYTLLEVPDSIFSKQTSQVERGLNFIRNNISPDGKTGFADPVVLDYPNYATSYALRLFVKHGTSSDSALISRMTHYLLRQQFTEQREIRPGHLVYGAWGFGEQLKTGTFGHVDLSHTRRVLQALHEAGVQNPEVFRSAGVFLRLLQKRPGETRLQPPGNGSDTPYDGGFYASPVIWGTNKAGIADTTPAYFQSYATATCDGLLALLASGAAKEDPRVQDAFAWLERHPEWSYPEGMALDNPAQWHLVLKLYHIAARSEAYRAMGLPPDRFAPALPLLAGFQQPDGRFFNPRGGPNKEDDPLVATALAATALMSQILK